MRIVKRGGHRLFTEDPDTVRVVSEMLSENVRHRCTRVRRKGYVQRATFKS